MDSTTHEHVRREVRASEPERLIPYGGVHARFTRDPPATSIA